MKAIILCAGYATRLYPLTQNQPKALLSVGDKPILDHIIEKLEKVEQVDEIYIITNDKFLSNFFHWHESYKPKKTVTILTDGTKNNEDRMGAVGDIEYVLRKKKIDDDIMLIAGDNLFEFSMDKFISHFRAKKAAVTALYDIRNRSKAAKKYGVVILDNMGKMIDFEEKPAEPKSSMVSTGCYIFPKRVLPLVQEYIKETGKRDNPGNFIRWLSQRESVYGFVFTEHWFDIGSFEALEEASNVYAKK